MQSNCNESGLKTIAYEDDTLERTKTVKLPATAAKAKRTQDESSFAPPPRRRCFAPPRARRSYKD